jgi:hypothetical protein
MKTYGAAEIQLHSFLTSVLDGGEWSVSCSVHFTPEERAPGTPWKEGWDTVTKRKIPCTYRDKAAEE